MRGAERNHWTAVGPKARPGFQARQAGSNCHSRPPLVDDLTSIMAAHTCAARASTAAVRTWRTGAAFERLHGRCSQRLSVSHGFAVPIRSRPISNVSDGGRAPDGGDDGKGREGIKNDGMRPLSSRFTKRSGNRMAGNEDRMPMLTLEHFLLRDKCVKLWRDFLRASRNIPNPVARRETVDWLRNEHFEGPSGLRQQADIVSSHIDERMGGCCANC